MNDSRGQVRPVVLAKWPEPGLVKSRLVAGGITAETAAEIALAMTRCAIERLVMLGPPLLAVTPDGCGKRFQNRLGLRVETIDQGDGDLGKRLVRLWHGADASLPLAFFGIDSPDVPSKALAMIHAAVAEDSLAIGPTHDGGYWTLAAPRPMPRLLEGIDWGSDRVYHQTCLRAAETGLRVQALPRWGDVDTPVDLLALRERLAKAGAEGEPAETEPGLIGPLARLARRLDELLGPIQPPRRS